MQKNGNYRVYAPQLKHAFPGVSGWLGLLQLRVVRESVLEKGVSWRSRASLRPRSEVGVRASFLLAGAWLDLGEATGFRMSLVELKRRAVRMCVICG